MCLGEVNCGFTLMGTLWVSWICRFLSSGWRSFQTLFFQTRFLAPFLSFLSFWDLIIWMLVHLMMSCKSLKLSWLFFIPFSFCCSDWIISTALQVYWPFLLLHIICFWSPLLYFSLQLLHSSILWLLFGTLYFVSLWNSNFILSFYLC